MFIVEYKNTNHPFWAHNTSWSDSDFIERENSFLNLVVFNMVIGHHDFTLIRSRLNITTLASKR